MMGEITLYEILKGHSFLAGLPESQLARLSLLAREVSFQEGDVILSAGQHSKHFYLLLSGSVCVEVCGRAYTICVQALGSGNAFGWSALLDHHDTLFQVRARESSTGFRLCAGEADLVAMPRRRGNRFEVDPEPQDRRTRPKARRI